MILRVIQAVETWAAIFLPGDEIHVKKPTPQQQRWIRDGVVQVMRSEPELAVVQAVERR